MAESLKVYYSSGTPLSVDFTKDPSDSRGGIITTVEVVNNLNNLFRAISVKALSDGAVEYRIVFLKNTSDTDDITDLKFFHKVPAVTATLDPADLVGLVDGSEFIVPVGAQGDWVGMDGKKATYILATTSWEFDFAPFATFDFGFIAPVDIDINETTLVGSFVDTLDTVFEAPYGVVFVNADGQTIADAVDIGSGELDAEKILAMVIRRTVAKQALSNSLFSCPAEGTFLIQSEIISQQIEQIIFSYDDGAAP